MIAFNCPACGAKHRIEEKFRGKWVQCSVCSQNVEVPAASPIAPELTKKSWLVTSRKLSVESIYRIIVVALLSGIFATLIVICMRIPTSPVRVRGSVDVDSVNDTVEVESRIFHPVEVTIVK